MLENTFWSPGTQQRRPYPPPLPMDTQLPEHHPGGLSSETATEMTAPKNGTGGVNSDKTSPVNDADKSYTSGALKTVSPQKNEIEVGSNLGHDAATEGTGLHSDIQQNEGSSIETERIDLRASLRETGEQTVERQGVSVFSAHDVELIKAENRAQREENRENETHALISRRLLCA